MSEYKKLMDRLAVTLTTIPKESEDRPSFINDLYICPPAFNLKALAMYDSARHSVVGSRVHIGALTGTTSCDTERFADLFSRSLGDLTPIFSQKMVTNYAPKVSKFGKRERNKVPVPVKEKQEVNSNLYTKKKKKRK